LLDNDDRIEHAARLDKLAIESEKQCSICAVMPYDVCRQWSYTRDSIQGVGNRAPWCQFFKRRDTAYVKPDAETVWPNPKDPCEIEWKLRYDMPTKGELLIAASYVEAYKSLFNKTQKDILRYIRAIKEKLK
jgi:hypothetical protein